MKPADLNQRQAHQAHQPGTLLDIPPTTLVPPVDRPKPKVHVLAYDATRVCELDFDDVEAVRKLVDDWPVVWIDIDGLGDGDLVAQLGTAFNLHPLALEDVLHVHQRSKVEQYGDHNFIVLRMARMDTPFRTEQLSMFLGQKFLITFQEGLPGDCLDCVRDRIRKGVVRIHNAGPDYLAYSLLDAIVDGYFPVVEEMGDRLENLEDEIIAMPGQRALAAIHDVKHDLRALRRAIWPMRDAFNVMIRDQSPLFRDETRIYLRDCYDHVIRIIDVVETLRELASDLMDLYLSSVNNRMSEVMKTLTIVTTIFTPLTVIVGVYGMNFDTATSPLNMPELKWYYGYPAVLALMAVVAGGLLYHFHRRGWLSSTPDQAAPTPEQPPPTSG